jgi:rhodanese-related sulfurtransferase
MTARTVSPEEVFRAARAAEAGSGPPIDLIDVRTPAEFAEVHAAGARSVPLDALDPSAVIATRRGAGDVYVICKTGARAAKAREKFHAAGFDDVCSIDGGTVGWAAAGLPVVRGESRVISLERQVRIAAGGLVLLGVVLGWWVHPLLYALSGLIGAGLIVAGVTDWCGMGLLLANMRWNRRG